MNRALRHVGRGLDRIDAGGWAMLLAGAAVVALAVLVPAYLENRALAGQRDRLAAHADRMQLHRAEYAAFVEQVRDGEPTLLRRLAWGQLRLRPVGTVPLPRDEDPIEAFAPVPPDEWLTPPPAPIAINPGPGDTRLIRLLTGPARPWVLAFGGWLILAGLLMSPPDPDAPRRR